MLSPGTVFSPYYWSGGRRQGQHFISPHPLEVGGSLNLSLSIIPVTWEKAVLFKPLGKIGTNRCLKPSTSLTVTHPSPLPSLPPSFLLPSARVPGPEAFLGHAELSELFPGKFSVIFNSLISCHFPLV